MKQSVAFLPENLRSDPPNLFHRLIVDWVGESFQMEFVAVVDQEMMGLPTADSGWAVHAQQVATEEESHLITADATLSAEEVASQVHNFVGCSIGRLLNDESHLKIDEMEEQDNSTCTSILEAMSAAKEECSNAALLGDEKALNCHPKIAHLRFTKKESKDKEQIFWWPRNILSLEWL